MIGRLMRVYHLYATSLYYAIRKKTTSRNKRKFVFLLLTPSLLLVCCVSYLYEHTIKRMINQWHSMNDMCRKFEYEIVYVAIAKNEGPYIREWIEYHRQVGVQKFLIYDNESTDQMRTLLEPYIQKGLVDYTYFPGRAKQLDAYYDALKKYRKRARYMGFFDLDEFVVPVEKKTLVDVIQEILNKNPFAGGVAINWYVYGSAGHKTKPQGLVMENYLYRAKDDYRNNHCVKTVVNPRLTKGYIFDPHTPTYFCGYHSVTEKGMIVDGPWNEYPNNSYEKIRINHYYCKSEEEGKIKFNRGLATHEENVKNDWKKYAEFDRNDVYDDCILCYRDCVKQALNVLEKNRGN